MEDVLDTYELPYNPERPVACMDEKPYQLLGETRQPMEMKPGSDRKVDYEYVREGTCSIFAVTEPLAGRRHVSVRERRTATDWAEEIKHVADVMYPDAEKGTRQVGDRQEHDGKQNHLAVHHKRLKNQAGFALSKNSQISYLSIRRYNSVNIKR